MAKKGWWSRLFEKKSTTVTTLDLKSLDGWGLNVASGERVNEGSALAISAVWACINLLAGTIGSLPFMVYRTRSDGQRNVAKDHPLYRLLHDSPNANQTSVDYWESVQLALELRGNSFSRIETIGNRVVAITPIFALVTVSRLASGSIEYRWTEEGKAYTENETGVLHIRGFGGHPLGGMSTLAAARESFGLSQAINRAASTTFGNGLNPSGALTFESFLTPEQRVIAETRLIEKYVGAQNAGRPMVLEGGTKWQAFSINPEDAQMLESRGFSIEEVCRWFGVPPHMIGHTSASTSWGTGIEQQTLAFQKFSLRRRLRRIEAAIEKQLLSPLDVAQGITVEFALEGLLRGDSAGRSAFYSAMTMMGAMTINEVRRLENLPPVEGGDVARTQMQNVPLLQAGISQGTP